MVDAFRTQAHTWWQDHGPFMMLHRMNPTRLAFLKQALGKPNPLNGLEVLDLGCGGGLFSQVLASEGSKVTGVDDSPEAIATASEDAQKKQLSVTFERADMLTYLTNSNKSYDVICILEVLEHVCNPEAILSATHNRLKPGGYVLISTLNRTCRSYLLGILAAEYCLGWVPPGTHEYDKFIKPSELVTITQPLGWTAVSMRGISYQPWQGRFQLSQDQSLNYIALFQADESACNSIKGEG